MPIIRKLIQVGKSKAVTLPKTWIEFWQRKAGVKITEVAVEVNRELRISPILPKTSREAEK
ncbi:hypothetical protein DRO19_00385 [Candidatus Bathyarchaeota archaeon]|nr:MAG: hypothetical protein DRO19_00385 [Candidatus Bathyarchaeota archaeon]